MNPHDTPLGRWKALAEVENKRARNIWGPTGGGYRRSETFGDPEITAARQKRDAQIEVWHAEGMSVREICRRTGLVQASVNRILRIRRLEARDQDRRAQGQA